MVARDKHVRSGGSEGLNQIEERVTDLGLLVAHVVRNIAYVQHAVDTTGH